MGETGRVLNQTVGLPGYDGFLGSRGSLMLDIVFLAMFAVVPLLVLSWYLVGRRRRYAAHKRLQLILAGVLLVTVVLFELDIRLHGWQERASVSPYWRAGRANDPVDWSLVVHLACAVPTFLLWVAVVVRAWRGFPDPPRPAPHSAWHRRWGWAAMVGMALTALTGWIFYWLAFVAG
jgi:uncharacterized membrane protein YozB (DUF420 family)